jgi:hypothetical protein
LASLSALCTTGLQVSLQPGGNIQEAEDLTRRPFAALNPLTVFSGWELRTLADFHAETKYGPFSAARENTFHRKNFRCTVTLTP